MTSTNKPNEYVSFRDAAELLVKRKLAPSGMTPQGLRYIARTRKTWPFGKGKTEDGTKREPYWVVSGTRMMRVSVLVEHFRAQPPAGRGPAKTPRRRREDRR